MKSTKTRVATVVACALALALALGGGSSGAQDPADAATAADAAVRHLDEHRVAIGLAASDVAGLTVTDVVPLGNGQAHAVHLQQSVGGIDIEGATVVVAVDRNGQVLRVQSRAIPGAAKLAPSLRPVRSAEVAANSAARNVGLQPDGPVRVLQTQAGVERPRLLEATGAADEAIQARLVLQPDNAELKLGWELIIDAATTDDVWHVVVDARNAQVLEKDNLTSGDSYHVFEHPTEAPSFGTRSVAVDPADPTASPFGWHDTDGIAGAEFTTTEGNNVSAYADVNFDQVPDPGRPDGGAGLVFDFAIDLGKEPIDSQAAAITNLFYWNNVMHDVLYRFGFDEVSGNFQTNNYGKGGLGGDAVRAEAQDGFTTNNANFFAPPDGQQPRMQMYLFTATSPQRDSSFDNGLVAHEYAHGLSQRLTGGPATATCLSNQEQAGEGWSDYIALMVTMQAGDTGSQPRGFGTYLLGEPTTGTGFRDFPYSTNMAVDPRTYASIAAADIPHGVGSVWAAMLWDMTWALIDRDGFTPDLINGNAGNTLAMQLVIDGMKLQPCDPGFVDARDAILLADQVNNASANECLIWDAFAKRGLGFSASQGDPDNRADGVEAFDVPPGCSDLTLSVSTTPASPGATVVYTVDITNNTASPQTGVVVTQNVPAGSTYTPGSVTCGGSEAGGVVTLNPGTIAGSSSAQCTFSVDVDAGPGSVVRFNDDMESGTSAWTISHGAGTADWAASTAQAFSGTTSMLATGVASLGDQYLATTVPVPIAANTALRFAHRHTVENTWDGGAVEVSADGINWSDAGPLLAATGYNDLLNPSANPLGGRLAFTGDSGGWIESSADLSSYAGASLHVRFRLGTDASIGGDGWYVDDVQIVDEVALESIATVSSNEGASDQVVHSAPVAGSTQPALLRVTTNPAVPSVIEVDGLWNDAFGLDWVELAPGAHQVCFSDVPGFTTPPCESVTLVPGVTTVVQGDFVTHGSIDITTSPAVASTVTVDGSPVNDWGAIVSIEPGTYQVCFGQVVGWDPPPCETAVVTAGVTTPVVGTFTANGGASGPTGVGQLRVTTSPAVVSQISIDGVGAQSFGLDWVKLSPGAHEICFSDVPGFATPPCETVTIVDGATTTTSGVFTPLAEIRVITSPPAGQPVTADGRTVDNYGFWTWAPAATYEFCTAGYTCQTVAAPAGVLTTVTLVPGP